MSLRDLYRPSLGLLTDLYQLTMAQAHHRRGSHRTRAVFHLFFRKNPFGGGFTVAAGLEQAIELIEGLRFEAEDLDYLRTLKGNDGGALFTVEFLRYLGELRFSGDVDAMIEGTAAFPHEPLVRVIASMAEAQLLETALLTVMNFQSLIATKAARVCLAAQGDTVIELGLRRAQGPDGGMSASRAAYLGGVAGTSNVLAGRMYGIPVRGTHAHAWVMAFETELEAFRAYAEAMPNNCVFLVDTYSTLDGVRHAIEVARELSGRGHQLAGIRLDSGDLAYLSIEARKLLDAAGLDRTVIVASNDLDEHVIASLKSQGAKIDVWGVGTRLVTGHDQPALGGVYKLSAMEGPDGTWIPRVKLSEQAIKVSTPGIQQVRRFTRGAESIGDSIWDSGHGISEPLCIVDPTDPLRERAMTDADGSHDLLVPIFRAGRRVYTPPPLADARSHAATSIGSLHPGVRRFLNPHQYPVGLDPHVMATKIALVKKQRGLAP